MVTLFFFLVLDIFLSLLRMVWDARLSSDITTMIKDASHISNTVVTLLYLVLCLMSSLASLRICNY